MKAKTIKKVLSKKLNEWLESITDEKVKNACKKDLIVTGGSIASMLLNEDVNDFDIYFKTVDTVKLVSEYYVNKSKSVGVQVIDNGNLPPMETDGFDGDNQWNFFIKGMARGNERRVKLFIPHVGYWRKPVDEDDNTDDTQEDIFEVIYITENAITLSDDIQLIIRFFGDADTIHENYDFAHATSYFHYDKDSKPELVLRPTALEALLTKELIYIGSKYPLTSVIRARKFITRGYTISAGTYFKILWQVSELDLKDPIVLQEQLVGVDIAYFSLLLEVVSKVEPSKLTYNYISEIVDRIFDGLDE